MQFPALNVIVYSCPKRLLKRVFISKTRAPFQDVGANASGTAEVQQETIKVQYSCKTVNGLPSLFQSA